MKILILYPGKIPESPAQIACFSDVWSYYLIKELQRHVTLVTSPIPNVTGAELVAWADTLKVSGYDAVIALGLRYFSKVDPEISKLIKNNLDPGSYLCQIHDGSRLDNDPVDITFTIKDQSSDYEFNSPANRFVRHHAYNSYVGWAADPVLNVPKQSEDVLRILVDHTNYGNNPVDNTRQVLEDIKRLIDSRAWQSQFQSISVRRFDSGRVVDVDFDAIDDIERYDRNQTIPYDKIIQEHCQAHIFCVTHPESVGLVVLETAMAGALPVIPKGFVPADRLATVRCLEYNKRIDWDRALKSIDIEKSREMALTNSWENVAKRIRDNIRIRNIIKGKQES